MTMPARRQALRQGAAVAALLAAAGLWPLPARAFSKAAFEAKTVADALKALGAGMPLESKDVLLTAPEIAENGAVVPITVATTLANARQLLVLVDKNPTSLVAKFEINEFVEPSFTTRAKMAQSSDVIAVVLTSDGKALFAKKEVKVTLGGCGG